MIQWEPEMLNNPRALRSAFGTFMTGVTVVTCYDEAGQPLGFTANSFASVSLEPPLVSVCLANSSRNYDSFSKARGFAINILAADQTKVSNTFALPSEDRFAKVGWQNGPNGSPVIDGVSAWFDCDMAQTVEAGDHVILIGEVKAFDHTSSPGLGYARGAYFTAASEAKTLGDQTDLVVSALVERDGKVLLLGNEQGKLTLPTVSSVSGGASYALKQLITNTGVHAEPGFVYSVYEDHAQKHQHMVFLCAAEAGTPTKGVFTELTSSTLADVADPAVCTMLERFKRESEIGNFGIYCGNEVSGAVKAVATGG